MELEIEMETQTERKLSILAIYNDSRQITDQAENAWMDLALKLSKLIPENLSLMAKKLLWVKTYSNAGYLLPGFLEQLIRQGILGKAIEMTFTKSDIRNMGFESTEVFLKKLSGLEEAWQKLVRIEAQQTKEEVIVYFYATET